MKRWRKCCWRIRLKRKMEERNRRKRAPVCVCVWGGGGGGTCVLVRLHSVVNSEWGRWRITRRSVAREGLSTAIRQSVAGGNVIYDTYISIYLYIYIYYIPLRLARGLICLTQVCLCLAFCLSVHLSHSVPLSVFWKRMRVKATILSSLCANIFVLGK